MILILSDAFDQSTNDVIDWVGYFKKSFVRVNDNDICEIVKIDFCNNNIIIKVNNNVVDFNNDISSYWYRRGDFNIKTPKSDSISKIPFSDKIEKNLKRELDTLVNYLHIHLKSKKGLGSYFDNYTNKLQNLVLAKKCGLIIPNTIVSSDKSQIIDFINHEKDVITKAISETIMFLFQDEGAIQSYTSSVDEKEINNYSQLIFPSIFQNNINKKYELRIFYLDGSFFSMAIFSQSSKKTETDFRNYNYSKPNRCVPYNLPEVIKSKLDSFMRLKNFKTGSIDMIVNEKNEYVFLEVNPVGQFGMTSIPCNYYLHKKIAEYLCA